MVEFFVRHSDHLTHTSVISDPVYLAEPEIEKMIARQPIDHQTWLFACDDGEQIRRAADRVPNYASARTRSRTCAIATRFPPPRLGGPETASPDLLTKLSLTDADGAAKTKPAAGPRAR